MNNKSPEELLKAEQGVTEEPNFAEMQAQALVSQTEIVNKPEAAISLCQNGREFILCTLGNFIVITGKAKSRKSFFSHLLIAVTIMAGVPSGDVYLVAHLPLDKRLALVFDTEMGKYHVSKAQQRILSVARLTISENLIVYRLRRYNAAERLAFIEYTLYNTPNIGIVLIDGLRDLITSINDEEQASMITSKLMRWSEELNICIICVLHQNKTDLAVRGTVGTEAQNKAEAVYSITKSTENKELSIVQPEFCREVDPETFAFSIDENGLPFIIQDYLPGKEAVSKKQKALLPGEIAQETHLEILKKVFRVTKAPKYNELLNSLKNEVDSWYGYSIAEAKIKTYITYYIDNEIIYKHGKTPHTRYQLENTESVK